MMRNQQRIFIQTPQSMKIELQKVQPMNQANQLTRIRPAAEEVLFWPGQQLKQSREETHARIVLGVVRLAIIAGLIFVTLATGV